MRLEQTPGALLSGDVMNTFLQMVLPVLLLPVVLSFSVIWLRKRFPIAVLSLIFIWLPSYILLNGWPEFPSPEANNWIWVIALASMLPTIWMNKPGIQTLVQSVILATGLAAIIWPLTHILDYATGFELLLVLLTGIAIFSTQLNQSKMPAMVLAISAVGLGLVTSLGGSLLIGQLSISLAASITAFALYELLAKKTGFENKPLYLVPVLQIYLLLLVMGRIYADVATGPVLLLLASIATGLLVRGRAAVPASATIVIAALVWSLLSSDASSYY